MNPKKKNNKFQPATSKESFKPATQDLSKVHGGAGNSLYQQGMYASTGYGDAGLGGVADFFTNSLGIGVGGGTDADLFGASFDGDLGVEDFFDGGLDLGGLDLDGLGLGELGGQLEGLLSGADNNVDLINLAEADVLATADVGLVADYGDVSVADASLYAAADDGGVGDFFASADVIAQPIALDGDLLSVDVVAEQPAVSGAVAQAFQVDDIDGILNFFGESPAEAALQSQPVLNQAGAELGTGLDGALNSLGLEAGLLGNLDLNNGLGGILDGLGIDAGLLGNLDLDNGLGGILDGLGLNAGLLGNLDLDNGLDGILGGLGLADLDLGQLADIDIGQIAELAGLGDLGGDASHGHLEWQPGNW